MRILIGSTGFVGQNLQSFIKFDHLYNSKNINTFKATDVEIDLYLACLPATKWLVNKDPISDFKNAINIFNYIKNGKYNNVYLFSTIDIYQNYPLHSNELTKIKSPTFGYGPNRYAFEVMITNNLKYNNIKIIRLPALFGPGLKKNILFDIKNDNEIMKINTNSFYQWYNMERLEDDLNKINLINHSIINMFPEPVNTLDFINNECGYHGDKMVYDFKTIHTPSGYWYDKDTSIEEIRKFLCK